MNHCFKSLTIIVCTLNGYSTDYLGLEIDELGSSAFVLPNDQIAGLHIAVGCLFCMQGANHNLSAALHNVCCSQFIQSKGNQQNSVTVIMYLFHVFTALLLYQ